MDAKPPSSSRVKVMDILHRGDNIVVWREVLDVGQELAWHCHSNVGDTFYVVRGPLHISTRDPAVEIDIPSGKLFQLDPGVHHRVSNTTDSEVEWILIQGLGEVDYQEVDG